MEKCSLHNIDFGVFWASWGGSGKEPGSGNPFWFFEVTGFPVPGKFREPGRGFDGFWTPRFRVQKVCSMGSDGWVLFPRFGRNRFWEPVPETRGTKKVPGSGDAVPNVPKVTLCFERILLYFERILCKLKVNFCTLPVYLCTLKVCVFALKVKNCTLKVCFCKLKI